MAHSYSEDLRSRIIGLIQAGSSARAAADRYQIGSSTAARWSKQFRETGSYSPKPRGNPNRGSKIDAYSDFILTLIDESCDLTLSEIQASLKSTFSIQTSLATLSRFFHRHMITVKKRPYMSLNKSATM